MSEEGEQPVRRRSRARRAGLVLLVLLVIAAAGLWLARKPIASGYADRFLAGKGVQGTYQVADLGFGRQRLVNVVLGDPANPDLVADWLEARTAIGLSGPYLTGVRAGRVRLRARLVDGKLSLGSIDRLLPPSSGKAFALPALDVDVADARVRLETPFGVAGLKIAGSGRLDDGFDGRVAVVSATLGGGCAGERPTAVLRVRTEARSIRLTGPVQVPVLACSGVLATAVRADIDATLTTGDRLGWRGTLRLASGAVRTPFASARAIGGTVRFAGDARGTNGPVDLRAVGFATAQAVAQTMAISGRAAFDGSGFSLGEGGTATVSAGGVRLADALLRRTGAIAAPGTPLDPLLAQAARAARQAGSRFDASAAGSLIVNTDGGEASVDRVDLFAASGARGQWVGKSAVLWGRDADAVLDGRLSIGGGGLPTLAAQLARTGPGAFRGTATMQPYAAGTARLALTPVAIVSGPGGLSARTVATLSGPLADGRVDGLRVPIDLVQDSRGLLLNRACAPVAWERVAISGLVLDRAALRLCPTGGAIVRVANGGIDGGATLGATRLTGRLGSTPVALAAAGARLRFGERGFALDSVQAWLGAADRQTRLDIGTLDGRVTAGGVAGRFGGAGGKIGAVPLLLTEAAGDWRFARGRLAVTGAMIVSDAQTDAPRLKPLPVRDVSLTLAGARIEATGTVAAPTGTRTVANIRLTHDLSRGSGDAIFTVPGLVFDKGLQPDQLTPVTFGVVADVVGTVTGEGRIGWTPQGVTSTGVFRTTDTDLAAAFGPVEGIAGEIRFTDLLALESAPGQRFTVASVNPGIAVTNGVVTFQTLRDSRVQVEGARWPFAGGTLTLDPTLLDFTAAAQRRMTFQVRGMAADQFLQQFDFKNLDATGTFDGALPMVFDTTGGRIENGRLVVREGGGTIAYVGPITQKDIGFWPNIAFQALKSLRYRSLTIAMNGPLAGEMVTQVRFAGVSQGEGAARGGIAGLVIGRLQRLPFVFNIRIEAPFRGLLDATASFYDPKRLIQRNLPRLLEEQDKQARPPLPPTFPIQPPASEKVP